MNLILTSSPAPPGDAAPVEVVERKGTGHPDTICDALAEEFSIALCRFYLDRFGTVLHHNVDKALLSGGMSRPAFGGGEVLAPFDVVLAGRAVRTFRGVDVPVERLAIEAGRTWLAKNLRCLDVERHVELHCRVRRGSVDLLELFQREQSIGRPLANDTSCGAGHAPRSRLENIVLTVEQQLNAPLAKERCPSIGEDIKVMGVRRGDDVSLTVSCAQIDRFVRDLDEYRDRMARIVELAHNAVRLVTDDAVEIALNAGDDLERGSVYLTVTGTSAEAGDDGAAGRGNRVGGLITPHRAMTLESAAGKNPITHVGKLYNVLALTIAEAIVSEVADASAAECFLVSEIGQPLSEPMLAQVLLATHDGASVDALRPRIDEIARAHLERADSLWHQLLERTVALY